MVREKPANRGTETSAEVLVAHLSERRSTAVVLGSRSPPRRRPKGPLRPAITMYPFPSASILFSASEGVGGEREKPVQKYKG